MPSNPEEKTTPAEGQPREPVSLARRATNAVKKMLTTPHEEGHQDWACDGIMMHPAPNSNQHPEEEKHEEDHEAEHHPPKVSLRKRITERIEKLPVATEEDIQQLTCDM